MTEAGRLCLEGVTKIFATRREQVVALDPIDLEVDRGEFVAIVGPSGCGKSTLLYMIAGFVEMTGGSARLDDRPITGPGNDRGIVFQEYSLFPWLNALQNVAYGLREKGVPRDERKRTAQRYLDMVGLGHAWRRYPRELSGGMKQRVALARTLAVEPAVLLLDEPFAAVDAITRNDLQQQLSDIVETTRTTTILVTHSAAEAVLLADRVVVFSQRPGRILEVIDVPFERPRAREAVVEHPSHGKIISHIDQLLRTGREPVGAAP